MKAVAWLAMTLAAIAIAGYAGTLLLAPEMRPPFAAARRIPDAHRIPGDRMALLGPEPSRR